MIIIIPSATMKSLLALLVFLFSCITSGAFVFPSAVHNPVKYAKFPDCNGIHAATTDGTVTADWTDKRLHNNNAVRSAALLGVVGAVGSQLPASLASVQAVIHILSFSAWFGTVAYTTFVLGITMFRNLPRQTFGKLQSKLFPKYFFLSSVALILQLVTARNLSFFGARSIQAIAVALSMTLLNQFYLEPLSTNNMMKRYELDSLKQTDTDEYKKLRAQFGKFHGMSSLTNLIALGAGVAQAVFLAAALV